MAGVKQNTIKLILRKKVDDWLKHVDDEAVRRAIAADAIITGGCITSLLSGERINDFDVYFRTWQTNELVAKHYAKAFNAGTRIDAVKAYRVEPRWTHRKNIRGETEKRLVMHMQSAGVASEADDQKRYEYFEGRPPQDTEDYVDSIQVSEDELVEGPEGMEAQPLREAAQADPVGVAEQLAHEIATRAEGRKPYRPVFFTDNAITLSDKVQLIVRFFGDPAEIHRNFDYVHATCYYDVGKAELVCPPEAMAAILSRSLVYRGSLYPIASLFRIRKFIERGWRISAGQMLKIIAQVADLDFKDAEMLKEQLIGVDAAYMSQLVEAINAREPGQRIDSTYIAALVDRIFE